MCFANSRTCIIIETARLARLFALTFDEQHPLDDVIYIVAVRSLIDGSALSLGLGVTLEAVFALGGRCPRDSCIRTAKDSWLKVLSYRSKLWGKLGGSFQTTFLISLVKAVKSQPPSARTRDSPSSCRKTSS
jgi:hypothetical protein